jgi:hypothetical protein
MQTLIPPQPHSPAGSSTPRRTRNPFVIAAAALLLSALLLSGIVLLGTAPPLAAQTPAASPPVAPVRKPVHSRKRHAAAQPPAPQAQAAPATVAPPPPPPPNWPVNNPPAPATVTWDSRGLRVVASNSSLEQILNEISTDTGAKVEGLGRDERIFGAYGPGQVRDVVSQLLDGTGYNVVMIGDQGRDEPLHITLSARNSVSPASAHSAAPAAQPNYDSIMDSQDHLPADLEPQQPDQPDQQPEQPEPQQPPEEIAPPAFQPGAPPNTPQQIQQQYQQQQNLTQPN